MLHDLGHTTPRLAALITYGDDLGHQAFHLTYTDGEERR
jgi:hypothetical protein